MEMFCVVCEQGSARVDWQNLKQAQVQEGEKLFVACDFHSPEEFEAAIEVKIAEQVPASEEQPPVQESGSGEVVPEEPKTVQDILNAQKA